MAAAYSCLTGGGGEGGAGLFRAAQGWDQRQQGHVGTRQLLTIQRKEISTKRVVKGGRPQTGCEISVPGDTPNSTERPVLSGRAWEEVAGPETSRWPFLLTCFCASLHGRTERTLSLSALKESLFAHNFCFKYVAVPGGGQYQEIVC